MTESTVRLDPAIVGRAHALARLAGLLVTLVGGSALVGWFLDIELLKGFHAGITMKANAAVALLLAGASLRLACLRTPRGWERLVGQGFAVIVGVIGAATLSQHVFGWDLRIDQLLFREEPGALATASPGRMGPPASLSFLLAGLSLVLLHARRAHRVAQGAALGIGLITLLGITGYLYSVETLYGVAKYTGIALHTAVALFVLGCGLLAVSVERGFASIVAGSGAGSVMTRRLLGIAVIAPLGLGWIRLRFEDAGYYETRFGLAALILAIIIILATLIARTALRLNRVEQQQLDAEGKLRDRLHDIETMMEVLPIGLLIATDRSATRIRGNRAARESLGVSDPEENLSLSARAGEAPGGFRVFQDGRELSPDELPVQRAAREGVAVQAFEIDVVLADGTVRHELITALPLLDAHGGTRGAVGAVMDITARRVIERERERLLAREQDAREVAEAANRAKDEFLATMSHELRTPLNAILGWASMLQDGSVDDVETRSLALATIERNCRAQAQLIEDLLDVSRIQAGLLRLELAPLDLAGVVSAAVDAVRPAAETRGVELRVILDVDPCPVRGDATRLQQVVWNVLANAVKFSPTGGLVETRLAADAGEAVLTVTDSGEGIAPEFLPHVFERFRQEEEGKTRRHGGLGLGLSIARHLVAMHDGRIEAASDGRGKGACFTVRIPLLPMPTTMMTPLRPVAATDGSSPSAP